MEMGRMMMQFSSSLAAMACWIPGQRAECSRMWVTVLWPLLSPRVPTTWTFVVLTKLTHLQWWRHAGLRRSTSPGGLNGERSQKILNEKIPTLELSAGWARYIHPTCYLPYLKSTHDHIGKQRVPSRVELTPFDAFFFELSQRSKQSIFTPLGNLPLCPYMLGTVHSHTHSGTHMTRYLLVSFYLQYQVHLCWSLLIYQQYFKV